MIRRHAAGWGERHKYMVYRKISMENRGVVVTVVLVLAAAVILGNFREMTGYAGRAPRDIVIQPTTTPNNMNGDDGDGGGVDDVDALCPDVEGQSSTVAGESTQLNQEAARQKASDYCWSKMLESFNVNN